MNRCNNVVSALSKSNHQRLARVPSRICFRMSYSSKEGTVSPDVRIDSGTCFTTARDRAIPRLQPRELYSRFRMAPQESPEPGSHKGVQTEGFGSFDLQMPALWEPPWFGRTTRVLPYL